MEGGVFDKHHPRCAAESSPQPERLLAARRNTQAFALSVRTKKRARICPGPHTSLTRAMVQPPSPTAQRRNATSLSTPPTRSLIFLLGALTFFLPCGITQSMQVAALASGSPVTGALIMGMFALGTLPMLSLLSFGSFRFAHSRYAPLFLQSLVVVVIGFGLFSILTGLAGLGVIPPLVTL